MTTKRNYIGNFLKEYLTIYNMFGTIPFYKNTTVQQVT